MDPIFSLVRKFGQIGPSEKFIFLSFENNCNTIWFERGLVFSIIIIKMKSRISKLGDILSAYLIYYNWSQSRLNIFIRRV